MSKSILYLEIIDDEKINLYQDGRQKVIFDNDLLQYQGYLWVILDSFYIGNKTFTRQVKDKNILMKVIQSSFSEYLLKETDAYQFSYKKIDQTLWVSWIETERLDALTKRFKAYSSNIIALGSLQLLLWPKYEATTLIYGKQFSYALLDDEAICLSHQQAKFWKTSFEGKLNELNDIDQSQIRLSANDYKKLPNLWIKKTKESKFPEKMWLMGMVLLFVIWAVNSFFSLNHSKKQLNQLVQTEQSILKQVFPKATGGAAYSRIKSEYNQLGGLDDFNVLQKINRSLSKENYINYLDIDLKNKKVILGGEINQAALKKLTQAGFTATTSQQNDQVVLIW